jgi:hypothetical protein
MKMVYVLKKGKKFIEIKEVFSVKPKMFSAYYYFPCYQIPKKYEKYF